MRVLVGRTEDGELIFKDKRDPESDLALETADGKIYMCSIYDVFQISAKTFSIKNRTYNISDTTYLTVEEAMKKLSVPEDDFMIKDIDAKLPDPYKVKIPPFTTAVILAVTNVKTPQALSRSQHKKKLTVIRSINEAVEAGKGAEMTVGKAVEFLSYYGLSLTDIIKPEYIIK